jgi:hypothetical protein
MILASPLPKPRTACGKEREVRFSRSRPWRSRGPSFADRAGTRRRGGRDDETLLAEPNPVLPDDERVHVPEFLATPTWESRAVPFGALRPILEQAPIAYTNATALGRAIGLTRWIGGSGQNQTPLVETSAEQARSDDGAIISRRSA